MNLVKRLSLEVIVDVLALGLVAAAAETGMAEEAEAFEHSLDSTANPIVYEINPPDNQSPVSHVQQDTNQSHVNHEQQATAPTFSPHDPINNSTLTDVTPFNLASLAQNGYFKAQGIPGYTAFYNAYEDGQITAKDIVAAAVNAHKLSPQYLSDQNYISAVDAQLRATTQYY